VSREAPSERGPRDFHEAPDAWFAHPDLRPLFTKPGFPAYPRPPHVGPQIRTLPPDGAPEEDPAAVPGPRHHDGDDDEWVPLPDAVVTVEADGVSITVRASGETAVHDAQVLLDAAVETVDKLRRQMQ